MNQIIKQTHYLRQPHLPNNHPLSLVSRNFRNLAITIPPNLRPSHIRSPATSIEYYDHNIIRSNQGQFLDDDNFANPQITEKFFIQSSYIFTLNILDKKHDHIISEALSDIQAYESFHKKFQTFSLTFHFLTPKERDLHCSHDIMLRTKQTHTYTYYLFIQNHFHLHTPSRQPLHRFQFINSK